MNISAIPYNEFDLIEDMKLYLLLTDPEQPIYYQAGQNTYQSLFVIANRVKQFLDNRPHNFFQVSLIDNKIPKSKNIPFTRFITAVKYIFLDDKRLYIGGKPSVVEFIDQRSKDLKEAREVIKNYVEFIQGLEEYHSMAKARRSERRRQGEQEYKKHGIDYNKNRIINLSEDIEV